MILFSQCIKNTIWSRYEYYNGKTDKNNNLHFGSMWTLSEYLYRNIFNDFIESYFGYPFFIRSSIQYMCPILCMIIFSYIFCQMKYFYWIICTYVAAATIRLEYFIFGVFHSLVQTEHSSLNSHLKCIWIDKSNWHHKTSTTGLSIRDIRVIDVVSWGNPTIELSSVF